MPVLGICFGAQALAAALGGGVEAAARKEVGWTVIDYVDPGLIPPGPGWSSTATGASCRRRPGCWPAMTWGRRRSAWAPHLAVQFHPEVDGAQLKLWLDAGGREEAIRAGHDPDKLLAETIAQEPASRDRADRLVTTAIRIAQDG